MEDLEQYTITINRDAEFHKIADSFLDCVNKCKDVEFGFINRAGESYTHKNGKWVKSVKEFKFHTPQFK